jgi:hypothetical protein
MSNFALLRGPAVSAALIISGCASTQLNYNTLDIASTVESVYTRQILANLSKFIDEPEAVPSQVDLSAGVIQTTNSVTPAVTTPFSRAITRNGADMVTSAVTAGTSATVTAADSWQQNWTVSPISDANTLRNFRALYRYAVYGSNIRHEYHVPRLAKDGMYPPDPYMLKYPHCVLCTKEQIPNPKLHHGAWLFWTNYPGALAPEKLPPAGAPVVDLGHYGNHELLMLASDFQRGYLSDFTLFLLPNAAPTDSAKKGGPGGPSAGRGPNFNVIVPQQIIPSQ